MAAETLIHVPATCFHCCSKCKGLFSSPDDHLKHQLDCNGNPFKSTSMHFACERKIYLQLFQTEDFQSDGNYSQPNMSKDDSFIDHVVKVRMPQDLVDPSIFLRTNTSSNLQIPLFDSTHLEPDVNKESNYLQQANKPRFSESIEPDQLRKIINKNIDYLKSDDITTLASQTSKDLTFPPSQGEPRLLSPIEKHFLPDGPKSRVQSPFEKCMNYLQDTGPGYQTGSLTYASNQSIPFSCNLTTDLLGGLTSAQDENLTSVDELPTLQYLDLAKKDVFLGQNPGLSQMNTKDPFLINATVRPERPLSATPRYPTQIPIPPQSTKSCEDLASPTFPLQDGNYFNFPSTLDEPTQLDYLDLATLDLLTNPSSFGTYGMGTFRNDRFADDREDIYSECNFLFHDQNYYATDNVEKSESKQSFEENVKLKKSKIKRLSLKKVKRGIEKKNKASGSKKNTTEVASEQKVESEQKQPSLSESLPGRPVHDKKRLKRTYSAEYEQLKPSPLSRKRKIMSSADTLNFRISPEAKRKVKTDRKFNESQRLCPTNTILNVKDSLVGFSEEEKKSMTAVIGTMGCIIVKKQKSGGRADLRSDQIITEVSTGPGDNQLFVLDGKNLQTYDTSPAKSLSDQNLHLSPASSGNGNQGENVKSVLKLKCQLCSFKTTSVTEFQDHRNKHDDDEDEEVDVESTMEDDNARGSEVHIAQTLRNMHFRSSSVDNPSDHINTLDNSVFSDESAYYKDSTESSRYAVDDTGDQADLNEDRRQSIEQLDETLLELCNQIDVESLSDSPPFAPQPEQCFTDVVERPEATNIAIATDRNLFDQFQNNQCFQADEENSYVDVVSTEAPMVEPILTAPNLVVPMKFSSESMFCSSASLESLGSDVIYTAQVLPTPILPTHVLPAPPTADPTNTVNRYQLPPTFDGLAQNGMLTDMVPETTSMDKQMSAYYVPGDNYKECKMLPDTNTNTVDLYLNPAPEPVDDLAAYVDTLTNKEEESQMKTQTQINSDNVVSVPSSTNVKMVSEETQTVDTSYIGNPSRISMFDITKTLCRSDERNDMNKLVSAQIQQDKPVQSNTQVCQTVNANPTRRSAFERVSSLSSSSNDSIIETCIQGASSQQHVVASAMTKNEIPIRQRSVPQLLLTNSSQTDPNGNILASSSTHTYNRRSQTKSYEYPMMTNRYDLGETAPLGAVSPRSALSSNPPKPSTHRYNRRGHTRSYEYPMTIGADPSDKPPPFSPRSKSESSSRSVVVKVDLKTNNVTVSEILNKDSHDERLNEMGTANLHSVIKEEKLTNIPTVGISNKIQGKDAEQFTSIKAKAVDSSYKSRPKKNGRRSRSEEVIGGCRAKLPRSSSTIAVQDHCYHTDGVLNLDTPGYHMGGGSNNTPGYHTNGAGRPDTLAFPTNTVGRQDTSSFHADSSITSYHTNSLGRTGLPGYHRDSYVRKDTHGYKAEGAEKDTTSYHSGGGSMSPPDYHTNGACRKNSPDFHTNGAGSKSPPNFHTNGAGSKSPPNFHTNGAGSKSPPNFHTNGAGSKVAPGYHTNGPVRKDTPGYNTDVAGSNTTPGFNKNSAANKTSPGYNTNGTGTNGAAERKETTGFHLDRKLSQDAHSYNKDTTVSKEPPSYRTETAVRKDTHAYQTNSTTTSTSVGAPGLCTDNTGGKDKAENKESTSHSTTAEANTQDIKNINKIDENLFMCEDCGYKTSRKSNFKAHTVKHNGVELLCSAPDCDFKTVHKRCLNFHLLKHNSEYRLLCDQCPFTTTDAKSLRRHMQIKHYHQYRFKCPECDHLSMFRERVANHYRNTHLQQKHFACNQCDYRTGYTHLLKFHLMAHAGIRPYKCSACDYQVNNVNKVTRHIKTRHKGQPGISCEKLDLNFEVDTKQFQCEAKTCDKDINVIELTEEQVAEIVEKKLAKQEKEEKCLQQKQSEAKQEKSSVDSKNIVSRYVLHSEIQCSGSQPTKCLQQKLLEAKTKPVFDPKAMQPKKMVSLLPSSLKSPEKITTEMETITVVTNNNNPRTNFVQIPISHAKIVAVNNNLVINRQSLDDSHLARTTSGYKGMENIWTTIKAAPQKSTSTVGVIKNETTLDFNVNELDSGYRCSMCEYKLESHEDIANHLLVCKMERHKLN